MKKFACLMVGVVGMLSTIFAQSGTTMPLVAGDTVVNTATVHKVLPKITSGYSGVVIQVKATEVDGTSAGTIGIYSSVDGTNYDLLGSAYTVTDVASQVKSFYITAPVPVYLRVTQTGAGTMRSVPTVSYVMRKYQAP
jgi:hypothetical protein